MRKTFFGRSVRAAQYKQATVFLEPAVQCSRIVSRWGTREDDRARELYITATTVASQHCSCTRRTTETTSLCQKFSKLWTNSVYCLQTEADNSHGTPTPDTWNTAGLNAGARPRSVRGRTTSTFVSGGFRHKIAYFRRVHSHFWQFSENLFTSRFCDADSDASPATDSTGYSDMCITRKSKQLGDTHL